MDAGLLSLKWNNHSSTFFHVLETIRKKELYSDVTIACDGKFFSVHKLVLSTCSEYFQEMFERTQCKHPIIVLKDINSKDLESLLNYMYIGEVNVLQTELSSLIKAAECLKVKGLAVPDEPPPSSKRSSKRSGGASDREDGSASKRNRRMGPAHVPMNQVQSPPAVEDRVGIEPSSASSSDSQRQEISDKEKRLGSDDQLSSHSFKPQEFDTVVVKSEKEDAPPDDNNFVPDELPPVSKFEYDGSPGDTSRHSGMDEGTESSYGGHLPPPGPQQSSDDSMGHIMPSTSRYGESSNWPSNLDRLENLVGEEGDKEGGEGGNYDPNAFLLDSASQAKAQMGSYSSRIYGSVAAEQASAFTLKYMTKDGSVWKCIYPQCCYQSNNKFKLSTHVRKHTGERPYACYLCHYRSNQCSNLYSHLKRKHDVNNAGGTLKPNYHLQ